MKFFILLCVYIALGATFSWVLNLFHWHTYGAGVFAGALMWLITDIFSAMLDEYGK